MDNSQSLLRVQVCYARPDLEILRNLAVPPGTLIKDAIALSGILQDVPEIDLGVATVGIYGKIKALDTVLRDHDRIEIYRPLIVDPKVARRRRVEKQESKPGPRSGK